VNEDENGPLNKKLPVFLLLQQSKINASKSPYGLKFFSFFTILKKLAGINSFM